MSAAVLTTPAPGPSHDGFLRMLDVLLSRGGSAMVLVEMHFDESGSHAGSETLCVAGYVMEKSRAAALSEEWSGVLAARDLPFFHMVACAHGNPPFDIAKADRIQVQTRMIQIIKAHTARGFACTLDMASFEQERPRCPGIGSAYTFCVQAILSGVRLWLAHNPEATEVAYFFEAGHASQGEANRIMEEVFANPELKKAHRYGGHAFVPKEKAPPVQAADLLAWQWYTDKRHEREGKPRRADCRSLMKHPHTVWHFDSPQIRPLVEVMRTRDVAAFVREVDGGYNGRQARQREWIEQDHRATPMCGADGFGFQVSVPGLDGDGAGIFLMGPVRPVDDRALGVIVTKSEEFVLRWASGQATDLGIMAPAVIRAAVRSGRVSLCWRDDRHETIQEGSLPLAAE